MQKNIIHLGVDIKNGKLIRSFGGFNSRTSPKGVVFRNKKEYKKFKESVERVAQRYYGDNVEAFFIFAQHDDTSPE